MDDCLGQVCTLGGVVLDTGADVELRMHDVAPFFYLERQERDHVEDHSALLLEHFKGQPGVPSTGAHYTGYFIWRCTCVAIEWRQDVARDALDVRKLYVQRCPGCHKRISVACDGIPVSCPCACLRVPEGHHLDIKALHVQHPDTGQSVALSCARFQVWPQLLPPYLHTGPGAVHPSADTWGRFLATDLADTSLLCLLCTPPGRPRDAPTLSMVDFIVL